MLPLNRQSLLTNWRALASLAFLGLTLTSCGSKENTGTVPGVDTSSSTVSTNLATGSTTASTTIPGITADDVLKASKANGLACSEPTTQGGTMLWKCRQETDDFIYDVETAGADAKTVWSVSAMSVSFGGDADATANKLFANVAALPYTGAEPEAARKWVEENMGNNADKWFGGVKYKLGGNNTVRTLTISDGRY